MAGTDWPVLQVVQAAFLAVKDDANLLQEALRFTPTTIIGEMQQYMADNGVIQVRPGYPNVPPVAVMVSVIPGESEEADQYVGEDVGVFTDDSFSDGNYAAEVASVGTMMSTTHHVLVFTPNINLCISAAKVVLWGLHVMRNWLTIERGFYEQRLIEGPLQPAEEWSAIDKDAIFVWRRSVHITHKWMLLHEERTEGEILRRVDVEANILGYLAP